MKNPTLKILNNMHQVVLFALLTKAERKSSQGDGIKTGLLKTPLSYQKRSGPSFCAVLVLGSEMV